MGGNTNILGELLAAKNFERRNTNSGGERVTTKCGTMLAGLNAHHDILIRKNGAHGHHSTGESLSENENVGTNSFPVASEETAGTAQTRLNLIGNE
jgi:hypothetical protein